MNAAAGWVTRVWREMEALAAISSVVLQERARWEEFSTRETLEIVVFGAYDAGKSSLLKRLLVEWGVPVPAWLTVSGRRETFEARRVVARQYGIVDTPGLGSGSPEHDEASLATIRLADLFLWVMPPQLVTSGLARFQDLLAGPTGIADAAIAVIARMDEAGIDPSDDLVGFAELCKRKKQELSSLITRSNPIQPSPTIRCVAADPYQVVGNTPEPSKDLYAMGRSWDGVEDLLEAVEEQAKRRDELRRLASVRFARHALDAVRVELRAQAEELERTQEGMQNEVQRHAEYELQLDTLHRHARAALHREVEDAISSASRSGGTSSSDAIAGLADSLGTVIDAWAESSFAELRRLSSDVEFDAESRMAAPSLEAFRRVAREAEQRDAPQSSLRGDPKSIGGKVVAFGPALRRAFREFAEAEIGMSLKTAAERLTELERSGKTVEAFLKSQERRAHFRSGDHAKAAGNYVKWGRALDAVGPLVEQLGGLGLDIWTDVRSAKQADERAQQRKELRKQVTIEADKLEHSAGADFDATCDGLRTWLAERKAAFDAGRRSISAQLAELQRAAASLQELVRAAPQ